MSKLWKKSQKRMRIRMPKRLVLRKCIACGQQREKKDLLRIVRRTDGLVLVDQSGKANGRGAYLCKKHSCIDLAQKRKRIESQLQVQLPEKFYEELHTYVTE